ncbi:MAG: tetratricopeptide repeat protein [Gammaproteobacteria bacterium]|nr:tetratricopeptide repeat protein [Gammaproteobacteria bacterium]
MPQDRFGYPLTTTSAEAAAIYVEALDRLFALHEEVVPAIDRAIDLDPDFALAHSVRARGLAMMGEAAEARASALRGHQLSAHATPRERRHTHIAALVAEGRGAEALPLVEEHASDYPRDAMPLSYALGVYGLLGFGGFRDFPQRQCHLLAQVAPEWDDDWWFLASYGWALVEVGEWKSGTAMLDRALELKPDNANAVHGRAHAYYECGDAGAGEAFLRQSLPSFARSHPLHGHLSWHLALFALQRGDADEAVSIYRDAIGPAASQALPMFTLIDSASFLWRSLMQGAVHRAEASELSAYIARHQPAAGLPFVNAHLAMACAVLGDNGAAVTLREQVEERLTDGRQASGDVVLRVCEAITGVLEDPTRAASILERAQMDLARLGGSNAQRDVFLDTLAYAHLQAGDDDAARSTTATRAESRAQHLDEGWLGRLSPA